MSESLVTFALLFPLLASTIAALGVLLLGRPGVRFHWTVGSFPLPERIALAALTCGALALRLYRLDEWNLSQDEVMYFHPWTGLLRFLLYHENQTTPPLYRAISLLCQGLWPTLAAGRLPAALFGAACVPLTWGLARKLGGSCPAALAAALVIAANPHLVVLSQTNRAYTIVCAVLLASTHLLLARQQPLAGKEFGAAMLLGVAGAWSAYFFLPLWGWLVGTWWLLDRTEPPRRKFTRTTILLLLPLFSLSGLLLLSSSGEVTGPVLATAANLRESAASLALETARTFLGWTDWPLPVTLACVWLLCTLPTLRHRQHLSSPLSLLLLHLCWFLAMLLTASHIPWFPRHAAYTFPLAVVALAALTPNRPSRADLPSTASLTALLLAGTFWLWPYVLSEQHTPYRDPFYDRCTGAQLRQVDEFLDQHQPHLPRYFFPGFLVWQTRRSPLDNPHQRNLALTEVQQLLDHGPQEAWLFTTEQDLTQRLATMYQLEETEVRGPHYSGKLYLLRRRQ